MSANDEEIRIALKFQGQAEAEALRTKMAALRAQILDTGAAHGIASAQVVALAADFRSAEKQVEALDKQFGRARSGMQGFGQTALQTGRIVQDFTQGGVGGILNNIEGIAQALGGGAGLAGALTIVGTAAFIAKPYLLSLFEGGGKTVDPLLSDIERCKARIKELSDKPIKLSVERAEIRALEKDLRNMTAAQDAYNAAKGLKGRYEQQSEAAVNAVIGESNAKARETGGVTINKAIRDNIEDKVLDEDEGLSKLKKDAARARAEAEEHAKGSGDEEGFAATQAALVLRAKQAGDKVRAKREELTAEGGKLDQEVGKIISGAAEGLADAIDKATENDSDDMTGLAGVAHKIRGASPAALKKKEHDDKGWNVAKETLARQREEQKADDDVEDQKHAENERTGKALTEQRHNAERKGKAAEGVAKHKDSAAEAEARRIAAASGIDEAGTAIIDAEAQRRRIAEAQPNQAMRRLFIERERKAGRPILSEFEAQERARVFMERRIQDSVDANGKPIANAPGVAGAMLDDILGAKGKAALGAPPARPPLRPPAARPPGRPAKSVIVLAPKVEAATVADERNTKATEENTESMKALRERLDKGIPHALVP